MADRHRRTYAHEYAELKMQEGDVPRSPHRGDSCLEGAEGYSPSRLQYSTESKDQRPPEEYDAPWEWSMNQNILHHMEAANGNQSRTPLMTPKRTISAPASSQSHGATGSNGQESSDKFSLDGEQGKSVEDKKPDEEDEDDEGYTHLDLEQTGVKAPAASGPDVRPKDRTGNYEKPWDLTTTRNELEEKLKAVSMLEKSKSGGATASGGPSPPHESDTRPSEGYDKPWDWKPHKKDDRPPEGYEKPWDWRPHQKDDRPPEEYEEPWDQKAKDIEIDLIHAKSAKDAAAAAAAAGKETVPSANGILGPAMGRKSDDTRPVDEYDDPWDQKMKKMGVTRTGSDSSSKSSQSPVLPSHVRSQSPKKGKSENWQGLVGERINPELPLDEQGWYHGSISRHDAEGLLRVHKEGSYLVRLSESNKLDYSLSLKSARGFMHMKITSRDGRYILGQFSQPFDSIPLMIHHYSMSKLPIKGQEHMSLMHPIIHELL